jgi:hypothetical protein
MTKPKTLQFTAAIQGREHLYIPDSRHDQDKRER